MGPTLEPPTQLRALSQADAAANAHAIADTYADTDAEAGRRWLTSD
jgi:hypothetical protein